MKRPAPSPSRTSWPGSRAAGLAVGLVLLLVGCGGSAPERAEPNEVRPVELGMETRHAVSAKDGRWTFDLVAPRGRIVLAAGWSTAAGSPPEEIRARAVFTDDAGEARALLDAVVANERGGREGWAEWIVDVPEEIAGRSGSLAVEVSDGAGIVARLFGGRSANLYVAAPASVPAVGAEARPDIILVSFDTLRADGLGCYGNPRETTPTMDRLAREGARCADAFAPSNWTLPSHYSMLTSLYPSAHAVNPDRSQFGGFRRPTQRVRISGSRSEVTLAERLRDLGFFTAAISEDGWVHPRFGFDQGFASFVADTREKLSLTRERTFRWLQEHRELPFFLFVHTYAPHQPYDQPPPYDTMFIDPRHVGYALPGAQVPIEFLEDFQPGFFPPMASDVRAFRALYDGEVRYVDDFVSGLLEVLREEGLDDRTVVVLTSDHGEEIFEHGRFGHGDALYDESLRVPLIFWGPGRVEPGVEIPSPASLLDILPTLVELAGGELRGDEQGRSLLPQLKATRPEEASRALFAEGIGKESVPMICAWRGREKYILTLGTTGTEELYDLARDPGETADLAATRSASVARFREAVAEWQAENSQVREGAEGAEAVVDGELLDRLRALGYVP